jgi:alkylation response protein AidB-like acyl-CoA dehydrogenase
MEFAFTPEQEQLRREARAFLSANREPQWKELAELGWLGVSLDPDTSFLEEAVLFEEMGRALTPGPYFATVALALPALDAERAARVAEGDERWSAEVEGLVPNLDEVDFVVTAEGAASAAGETLAATDETRPLGRLAAGPREPLPGMVEKPRALAAAALEAVGVAQHALALAVEYAKTREQWGRPIGGYQAVSHALADTFVETELARSLAYWAAWCVAVGDRQAPVASAAAKAQAAEAAVAACERSIQVHGGIGFTWEHELHRYYKRAQWIQAFWGFPAAQRAEVAAAILEGETAKERDGLRIRVA